jgi:dsRNA-specific ribonuclease
MADLSITMHDTVANTMANLFTLQEAIGYQFNNISLLEKALTAPGAEGVKKGSPEEHDLYNGNRKLAALGDSILLLVARTRSASNEASQGNNPLTTL